MKHFVCFLIVPALLFYHRVWGALSKWHRSSSALGRRKYWTSPQVFDNGKKDLGAYWKIIQDIPLNPFVQDPLGGQMEKEGGSQLQAKTINMRTGSQPKGNSWSPLLPISIHQREMPFTNPHITEHKSQEQACKLVVAALRGPWTWGFVDYMTCGCTRVLAQPLKYNAASPAHKECGGNRPWGNLFERETH